MKKSKTPIEQKTAGSPSLIAAGAKFALAMLALAALFAGAVAEDEKSADDWFKKSLELDNNGSREESLQAIDKAIELDSRNSTLWAFKADCLSMAGVITQNQSRFDESLRAYDRAIELDPGNMSHIFWKGYTLREASYGLRGEDLIRTLEEALKVFDRALEIDPNYAEAWSGKGMIFDDLAIFGSDFAMYNDSLAAYDKAIELTPESDTRNLAAAYEGKAVALSHLGQDLAAKGQEEESMDRLQEAVRNYDKVTELDSDYFGQEAEENRAGTLEELGKHDEAVIGFEKVLEHLNKSLNENPRNSGVWVNKAILFLDLGQPEAAVAALKNATQMTPDYVQAWWMTGDVLSEDLGRYEQSLEAYDQALQLDPAETRVWTGKGDALRSLGGKGKAVEAYDHALEIDPSLVAAWSGKGSALRGLGRDNESVVAYDRALKAIEQGSRFSSPSLAAGDAWSGKAESLAGADRAEEASEAYGQSILSYEKAIQIDPESAKAWMGKGDALLRLKRQNESVKAYEKALELLNHSIERNPQDVEARWLKAESLDSLGRSEAALEAYDEVTALNGSKALGAGIRKADILARLGRYNESLEAFDGALGLLPTEDKQSMYTELWDEDTRICYSAWLADGQILRTSSAWYNRSCGDFENIIVVSSDRVAAWQRPVPKGTISPQGGQGEALISRSTNWEMIGLPRCCGDACKR